MELRHLEYFAAVAQERSFTRAAARLNTVQSNVSAAVRSLERELGAALLERTSRTVSLTDAGAALLPRAHAVLDAARDARDAVSQVRGGLRGTLRVGTLTSVGLVDLPELLGRFHRQHPGVRLQVSVAPSGSGGLVEALRERRLDVALVSVPGPAPAGIRLTRLAESVIDLVVPDGHRLADREEVHIGDLADLEFIDFPVGYGNRTVADRAFAAASVARRVGIEITDIATGADFVRHGLGIALLPRFVIAERPGTRRLTVTGADLTWPLSLAVPTNRPLGAAARALRDLIAQRTAPA
ncbi:LysR family transcriptional regulator [Kineococcus glutinatus]|uniref:LysR family transcriptional regulator n=1 Tax=Kineococcus glutinatus TaxID=1070872 RepID=A0ABP9H8B6_9ACTN